VRVSRGPQYIHLPTVVDHGGVSGAGVRTVTAMNLSFCWYEPNGLEDRHLKRSR
jgi:hypothetical protein